MSGVHDACRCDGSRKADLPRSDRQQATRNHTPEVETALANTIVTQTGNGMAGAQHPVAACATQSPWTGYADHTRSMSLAAKIVFAS